MSAGPLPVLPALIAILVIVLPCTGFSAETAVFAGTLRDSRGRVVVGAMVTATNHQLHRGTTVFAGSDGQFRFPPLEAGEYSLRVRRPGYQDLERNAIASHGPELNLTMVAETDPRELSWQLPASRWLSLVRSKLSSDAYRSEFVHQCTHCHQFGSWATRVQRSSDDWEQIFNRMALMGGNLSPGLRADLPTALNAAFDERNYVRALTQPEFVPPSPPTGAAASAVITEWDVGDANSMLHDVAAHPDGTIWVVDSTADRLYQLDPLTNKRKEYPVPTGNSPLGGVFHSTGLPEEVVDGSVRVRPHSLQVAPDSTIWVTLSDGNKIGHLDPHSSKWVIFPQREGLYPHTLRIDRKGRVWYTLAVSNHIGMIDPRTHERRTYQLPAPTIRQALITRALPIMMWVSTHLPVKIRQALAARATAAFIRISEHALADPEAGPRAGQATVLPMPYGIDVAPDGGVWFSQLNAQRIGRLDPDTGKIKVIETPFVGPRRLRFDSKGNLWIPGFSSGVLARYTPASGRFKTYRLPTQGVETPYALNVDRRTDMVWICGTASDTIISFDPRTERFTTYPLPTRVSFTREVDFDHNGGIWTSTSSFPAWHMEAPSPRVIRLQPGATARPD